MRDVQNNVAVRYSFVGMLFALVVANSSKKISEIMYLITDGWATFYSAHVFFSNEMTIITSLSHEILVLFVVASSWIGWTRSIAASSSYTTGRDIHDHSFGLLVLEVILVTLYFALSESNELRMFKEGGNSVNIIESINYSALPEIIILTLIFFTYAIWDYFSDIYAKRLRDSSSLCEKVLSYSLTGPLVFCFSSMASAGLMLVVYFSIPKSLEPWQVAVSNLSQLFVVLFFYKSKCIEGFLITKFPVEKRRVRDGDRSQPPSLAQIGILVIILFCFISSLLILLFSGSK